jgi:hypothetical protein
LNCGKPRWLVRVIISRPRAERLAGGDGIEADDKVRLLLH